MEMFKISVSLKETRISMGLELHQPLTQGLSRIGIKIKAKAELIINKLTLKGLRSIFHFRRDQATSKR